MPALRNAQIIYIAVWVIFYTIIETLFAQKIMFVYGNHWNNWHNIWLNATLFIFLVIHYRKPVWALILALPAGPLFYFMFPVPLYLLNITEVRFLMLSTPVFLLLLFLTYLLMTFYLYRNSERKSKE